MPPKELIIEINNNSKFINSKYLSLNLFAIDTLSGISEMSFSFDGVVWTSWETFNQYKTMKLNDVNRDLEKAIYFRVKDHAGNLAEESVPLVFDITPPEAVSIIINDQASESSSTEVILKLDASDNTSGLNQMSFSFDGNQWSPWIAYCDSYSYTLQPENGIKTIYFRVNDKAGNIAEPISASIKLKSTTSKDSTSSQAKESINSLYFYLELILIIIFTLILIIILNSYISNKREFQKKKTDSEICSAKDQQSNNLITENELPILQQPPQLEQVQQPHQQPQLLPQQQPQPVLQFQPQQHYWRCL